MGRHLDLSVNLAWTDRTIGSLLLNMLVLLPPVSIDQAPGCFKDLFYACLRQLLAVGAALCVRSMVSNLYTCWQEAQRGGFWSYVAGTAAKIMTEHEVRGLAVDNHTTTLPLRKGLSSSAAICVLVSPASTPTLLASRQQLQQSAYSRSLQVPASNRDNVPMLCALSGPC